SFKINTAGDMWFTVLGSNPERIPLGVKTMFAFNRTENNGRTYNNVIKETFKIEKFKVDPEQNSVSTQQNNTNATNQSTYKPSDEKYSNQESIIRQNALRHATQLVISNSDWIKNKSFEQITLKTIEVAEQLFHYSKDGKFPDVKVETKPNVVADDFFADFDSSTDDTDIPF